MSRINLNVHVVPVRRSSERLVPVVGDSDVEDLENQIRPVSSDNNAGMEEDTNWGATVCAIGSLLLLALGLSFFFKTKSWAKKWTVASDGLSYYKGPSFESGQVEDQELSFLAFNILAPIWIGFDEEHTECGNFPKTSPKVMESKFRRPRILKTILEADADVVCLTEVQQSELDFLAANLNEYEVAYFAKHEDKLWRKWIQKHEEFQQHGNAFFIKSKIRAHYEIVGATVNASKDGCNVGVLTLNPKFGGPIWLGGEKLTVGNVHLSHPTDKYSNAVDQAKILEDYMKKITSKSIVCGDLNAMVHEQCISLYTKNLGYTDEGKRFNQLFKTCTSTKGGTQRIDYFLTKNVNASFMQHRASHLKAVQPYQPEQGRDTPTGGVPEDVEPAVEFCGSDHLPLYLEIGSLRKGQTVSGSEEVPGWLKTQAGWIPLVLAGRNALIPNSQVTFVVSADGKVV